MMRLKTLERPMDVQSERIFEAIYLGSSQLACHKIFLYLDSLSAFEEYQQMSLASKPSVLSLSCSK